MITEKKINEARNAVLNKCVCLADSFDKPNCSSSKPIGSHSIAKSSILSKISEANCVYNWDVNASKILHNLVSTNGETITKFEAKNKTSATKFSGFCHNHDANLFNRIDVPLTTFDPEVVLQLHYRAVSYEFFEKKCMNEMLDILLEEATDIESCILTELYSNIDDFQREKTLCESLYPTKNISKKIKGVIYRMDIDTPLVAVGCWIPVRTVDFTKSLFDFSSKENAPVMGISLGLDASNHAFLAFTYEDDSRNCYVNDFIRNFDKCMKGNFIDTIVLFCFQRLQNVCARISWYDSLDDWQKKFIEEGLFKFEEENYSRITKMRIFPKRNYSIQKVIV